MDWRRARYALLGRDIREIFNWYSNEPWKLKSLSGRRRRAYSNRFNDDDRRVANARSKYKWSKNHLTVTLYRNFLLHAYMRIIYIDAATAIRLFGYVNTADDDEFSIGFRLAFSRQYNIKKTVVIAFHLKHFFFSQPPSYI